jgi:M6 family metalloprotease-like protein
MSAGFSPDCALRDGNVFMEETQMRTERHASPGPRAAAVGALLHLALCGLALAAPLGSFGNHNVTSAAGIDVGHALLPRAMADVNADGRADYCRFVGTAPGIFLSCALALPSGGFGSYDVNSDPGFDAGYGHLPREMADVNGDGRADFCRFVGHPSRIFLSCALATAERTFGSYDLNSEGGFNAGLSDRPRSFADVNGDGRADYCRFVTNGLGVRLSCGLSGSSGFGAFDVNSAIGLAAGDPGLPRGFADANNDGRTDFCRFLGSGSTTRLSCALAQAGTGFGSLSVQSATVAAGFRVGLGAYPRGFGDVTSDGRVDYCRFLGSPAVLSCAAADGKGGFGNRDVDSAPVGSGLVPYPAGKAGLLRALADVDANGRADYCRFIDGSLGTFLSCGLSRPVPAGSPNFAGAIFTPKIRNALGVRRVVAILWDPHRTDHPALPAETIDRLLFGANPSVRDWYRENSANRFRLAREAVLGWYPADRPADHYWAGDADKTDAWLDGHVEKWAEAIRKADVDFDFGVHDLDGDKTLEPEELAILIVIPQNGPFGTVREPAGRQVPAFEPLIVDGVRIPVIAEWYTGSPANLGAPAHELSHVLLGTPDLYMNAPWAFAAGAFSIMDASYTTTHFDPFIKLKTGWLSTRAVTASGTFVLRDVETRGEALILYDPARGPGEYFLIENRWRGASYDLGRAGAGGGLANSGIAIWHILENPSLLPLSTPPIGGPGEWGRRGIRLVRANGGVPQDDAKALFLTTGATVGPGTTPAKLRWIDGSSSGFTVKLLTGPGPAMTISVTR